MENIVFKIKHSECLLDVWCLIRGDELKVNNDIIQIIKDIQGRYFTFIIICFIISLFTWYHLYCFNNIYPHMQSEWLVFSVLIILCIQVLSLLSSLLETILRFISFRFKSEKLFKLSLLFS